MKTFKTPKGTELPLLNLKGKDYLQVQHRLVWFREDHADWGISTEFLQLGESLAVAKATITDNTGKILAQGTKSETPKGFADFIEKAESGAIGRALALCGYGTQFAQDLDEGERLVDSPAPARPTPTPNVQPLRQAEAKPEPRPPAPAMTMGRDPGKFLLTVGKFAKGGAKRLEELDMHELAGWHEHWISRKEAGEEIGGTLEVALEMTSAYLDSLRPPNTQAGKRG